MVLHQPVGLKRVGADLAAEAALRLSLVELPSLFPALGELVLVQTRAKDLHGHLAVFVLAALVLALHSNAGGEVGDSHSGVGNVDVLAAMTTGAEGVDAQVFGFEDRKSTRLNSSHLVISYAVFCLKKKKKKHI